MPERIVIVGGGQAAAVAVKGLRRRKYGGPIVIVGEEKHLPYQRPPLSKEYLAGEQAAQDACLLDEAWCVDKGVDLRLGARARGRVARPGRCLPDRDRRSGATDTRRRG
jgi:3-phenylpropionate/trans-cinnamate dioxygenase ferredoxin reductase subunit